MSRQTFQSEVKGCALGDDTIGYDCRTESVNFQNRENSEVICDELERELSELLE